MFTRRSRLALVTTFTELKAMAASAITGYSNPKIAAGICSDIRGFDGYVRACTDGDSHSRRNQLFIENIIKFPIDIPHMGEVYCIW